MKEEEVKRTVIEKALKDAAFKAELLKDPKAAIKSETGAVVPESLKVKIVEDTPSVVHFVLTRLRPAERDESPSKQEVKAPAGGGEDEKKRAKLKADLAKNPRAAVEGATGVKVPEGATVKVVEDSAAVVHLVLPRR